ncbi:hypothetical protein Bca4012_086663 [Brassica carinata]
MSSLSSMISSSSSSSTFLASSSFNRRTRDACLPMAKRVNTCKCVATPQDKIEYKTNVSRNSNMSKLQAGYLFPEVCISIPQAGALACLTPQGLEAMHKVVGFYKENTNIIIDTFTSLGYDVYGGKNAPYVWVHFPNQSSWDVFAEILEKTHVVTTPGSGFGPGGEGFVRVSAFGHRENILEACRRFKQLYK